MNTSPRILLIEDNPDDRVLIIRELRKDWPHVQVEQVGESIGLARALEAGGFDLVISDYYLGWTNGLVVLRAVKARWPDCPVIMFTGTGSEEIAVEAMKAGLDDYVLKALRPRLPAAVRSVLERTRQRVALKEAETRYRSLFEGVPVGVVRMTPTGQILDANPALVQMFGYTDRESLLGANVIEAYVNPEDRRRWQAVIEREGVVRDFEAPARRTDGTIFWGRGSGRVVRDSEGRTLYYEGIVEDVTARKLAEKGLRRSREELRALAGHLQSAREEERIWIAREIHDELGQALTALKIDLSWLESRLPKEMTSLTAKTRVMSTLIADTIQSVRKIATALRPGVLDNAGLTAAIEWQAQEFQARTGIECALTLPQEEVTLDKERALPIFRIFQETLTNIARHAGASKVAVGLKANAGRLILEVHDNGRGITATEASNSKSLGLLGMRERALLIGGEVSINGGPGKGTRVTVQVPLSNPGAVRDSR